MKKPKSYAVFRHELFKQSEPFIREQADSVPGWTPFYTGRTRSAHPDVNSFALWDDTRMGGFSKGCQSILRSSKGYIEPLRDASVELIHAHFGVEGVYAEGLAKEMDVPLVTTFHGYDVTLKSSELLRSMKPAWINYVLFKSGLKRRGDLFVCVSRHIERMVLESGFPEGRVVTHYMGVDVDAFAYKPVAERSGNYILHVGRLVEKKGCIDLINAFRLIHRGHPDIRLVIVGAGPMERRIRDLVDSSGLSSHVDLLGGVPREQARKLMENALMLCQPSRTAANGDTEGLPIVLMEAAATGTPIVSTFHAGIPELIKQEVNGLLVEEGDVGAIAEAMRHYIISPAFASRVSAQAREIVEDSFNVKVQSAVLGRLYEGLL
ncbi:glycosyltransferase [Stenotrophomonas hibiscicola]|uniref:glycosyltransferase n=1 Tax=Stenotrophomonas hibiscicola TaxID=86189 RepID=UPI0032110628